MNLLEKFALLFKLRCMTCSRAPSTEEVNEMIKVFGHKIQTPDEELEWQCLGCMNKSGKV